MCHNKAKPEDYKDRTQLVYNAQVSNAQAAENCAPARVRSNLPGYSGCKGA